MALNFMISDAARTAACNAIAALVDSGPTAGVMRLRTGAPPTNPQSMDSGSLLSQHTMSATAFGTASAGVATANAIAASSTQGGTVGHFRIYNSANVCIMQGTVDVLANTPDLVVNNVTFVSGGNMVISSVVLTVPA